LITLAAGTRVTWVSYCATREPCTVESIMLGSSRRRSLSA
jgi:hypothetical protein